MTDGDDTEFTVSVYCDDASTRSGMHNGRTAKVMEFLWSDHPDIEYSDSFDHWWCDRVPTTTRSRLHAQATQIRDAERGAGSGPEAKAGVPGSLARALKAYSGAMAEVEAAFIANGGTIKDPRVTMQTVYEDGHVRDGDAGEDSGSRAHHLKYVMKCDLCGLEVQARHDRTTHVLEPLRLAGQNRISLTALAGILNK